MAEDLFDKYKLKKMERSELLYTDFPKPIRSFILVLDKPNNSMEEPYFWILNSLRENGIKNVEKTQDTFAASEHSAYFGDMQTRLGAQQDRVSQNLAQIGRQMTELFPMVRELRIIDERLGYYFPAIDKDDESADITLKGYWADLVDNAGKNPASMYSLAQTDVGFVTLPDLFFKTHIKTIDIKNEVKVKEIVDKKYPDFNVRVKSILTRKLVQYYMWRKSTFEEHKVRRNFQLKYLYQFYQSIKMYMAWIKPYLRQVKQLGIHKSILNNPDIVSAFEQSIVEVEFLSYKKSDDYYAVNIYNFNYRTRPEMLFQRDYRHKGAVHIGRLTISMHAYAWTKEELDNFKALRKAEDLALISDVLIDPGSAIQQTMDALGEDLKKYLDESEKVFNPPKKKTEEELEKERLKQVKKDTEESVSNFFEPFKAPFTGLKDIFDAFKPEKEVELKGEKEAIKSSLTTLWNNYKYFKKSHGLLAW